jgi:hypothetical protein
MRRVRHGTPLAPRAALRPLTEARTLHGTLTLPLTFGRLAFGHDGVGEPEICWLT